jgi:HEAT repeat protein
MARADAVRVLGASVRFGEAAAPALTAGLASSKAFLRHGCALALALLRTEAGTEAVIDLLLSEPTEIWREVARAVGQVGLPALGALAGRLGRIGELPGADERIAWAMAHVAVRGGQSAIEALAAGTSGTAPVARLALELVAPASRDQVRLRATSPGDPELGVREITVNRAFSRRFFEAADRGKPGVAVVELEALEKSGPMELPAELLHEVVDDEDVIDASDLAEEAELDESDIVYGS